MIRIFFFFLDDFFDRIHPIHIAINRKDDKMFFLLIRNGAKIDVCDSY